jgi:hypothetical protein
MVPDCRTRKVTWLSVLSRHCGSIEWVARDAGLVWCVVDILTETIGLYSRNCDREVIL